MAQVAVAYVEVRPDLKGFGRRLQTELKGLNRRKVEDEGGRQGKGFADSFSKQMKLGFRLHLGQLAPILGLAAVTAAPLTQMVSSLGAGMLSLGAASSVMAASVGVAGVGAMLAMGQAAGTAAFAVQGMGDSLKALDNIQTKVASGVALTQGDLNNYQEAMARLSPAAQSVVTTLGGVNRAMRDMRKGVQERLFAGVAGDITALADAYLPSLQRELLGTAGVLNRAGRAFGAWASQASVVRQVTGIMGGNTRMIDTLTKAIIPLAGAALTLVQAFQPLGQLLSLYVARWAAGIGRTVAAAQASGKLAEWMAVMRTAMEQAFRIIGSVGKALGATFTSVLGPGFTLLTLIESLAAKWAAWATSITGRAAITKWAADAIPTLVALGHLIGDISGMFGRLASKGNAASFVDQIRSILPPLEALLTQLSASNAAGAFAEGLAEIGQALANLGAGGMLADAVELAGWLLHAIVDLVTAVPGLTTVIGALVAALTAMAAVRLVATITGLRQIPLLIGSIGAANTTLKAFIASWTAMQAGMGASRISVAISNIRLLGATLTTTTGFVAILRAAMTALWASMVSNPIGWIALGLGVVATAVYAIANASKKASTDVSALATSLGRVGATTVGPQVEQTIASLRRLSTETEIARNEWGVYYRTVTQTAVGKAAQSEADQVTAAANGMAETYGRNVDTIIGNLRAWGVAETTSSGEILTAMANIQAANNGMPLSVEQMSTALASLYGVMGKDYAGMANTFQGLHQQIASGYGEVGEAALDSAVMQIQSMQLALKAANNLGGSAENELNAQLAGIASYRKALKASKAEPGDYGAGLGGGGVGGAAAAKRQGAKTAAGFITSFNAAISDLDPMYLLKKSAQWTAVGTNIATYLAKGLTSGAKNIANVSRYIARNFGRTYIKQIQAQITAYRKALVFVDPATGKAQGKQFWEDRLQEIKDFKQRAIDSLTAGANLVNYFGFIPTPQEVQRRMTELLTKMRNFTAGLADLQQRGLSKELAAAWLEAGYDTAGNLVEGMKDATAEEISSLNASFGTLTAEAQKTADTQATKFFGMGQKQVEGVIRGINSRTAAAVTAINRLMNQATAAAKGKLNWTKVGQDAMDSFNAGVNGRAASASSGVGGVFTGIQRTQGSKATATGKYLATAMMDGYNKALRDQEAKTKKILIRMFGTLEKAARIINKAKSPSMVYYDLGVDVMTGYQLGLESMQRSTVASVKSIMGAVAATSPAVLAAPTMGMPITPAYAGTSAYNALPSGAQPPVFDVRVFVGDREITDIVRTEVESADDTRARALLAGRRGG